jgi:hypothetical protein
MMLRARRSHETRYQACGTGVPGRAAKDSTGIGTFG